MQHILSNVSEIKFNFEDFANEKLGVGKEDEKKLCKYYQKGSCSKGRMCPFRHSRAEKSVVCKHWLRGLCKKGKACEFLHEYDLKRMPECWFFSKYGECSNPECQYLHIDPNSRVKQCPWYDRGFCKHGPDCRNRHLRRIACPLYITGFCPEGRNCEHVHPKYELPEYTDEPKVILEPSAIVPNVARTFNQRALETVTCYKCGERGHYANRCTNKRNPNATPFP